MTCPSCNDTLRDRCPCTANFDHAPDPGCAMCGGSGRQPCPSLDHAGTPRSCFMCNGTGWWSKRGMSCLECHGRGTVTK